MAPMKLSEHFNRFEFERSGAMPDEVVPSYVQLCVNLLEPIRQHYGRPLLVTSGYRSPESNAATGGVSYSQHIATPDYCAADWLIPTLNMRDVFDWIRMEPTLAFDQVILEHGGTDIIHISWSKSPRVMALEGATHGRTGYIAWPTWLRPQND